MTMSGIPYVKCMAFDSLGNLYVGGNFETVNTSTSAHYVAKWDGSNWSALGGGMTDEVTCCVVDLQNNFIVGGLMDCNDVIGSNLFKWTGLEWVEFGSPNYTVHCMICTPHGNIYIGGEFTDLEYGAISIDNVAKWNGSNWSMVGGGLNGTVRDLKTQNSLVYAAGDFTMSGAVIINHVGVYNGSTWAQLGTGHGQAVQRFIIDYDSTMYIISSGYVYKFITSTQTWELYLDTLQNPILHCSDNFGNLYISDMYPGGTAWLYSFMKYPKNPVTTTDSKLHVASLLPTVFGTDGVPEAFTVTAPEMNDNYGILVGTDTSAVSPLSTSLGDAILNTILKHKETWVNEPVSDNSITEMSICREFVNEGSEAINIKEVGLIVKGADGPVLVGRTLLDIIMPAASSVTIEIYISTTV